MPDVPAARKTDRREGSLQQAECSRKCRTSQYAAIYESHRPRSVCAPSNSAAYFPAQKIDDAAIQVPGIRTWRRETGRTILALHMCARWPYASGLFFAARTR